MWQYFLVFIALFSTISASSFTQKLTLVEALDSFFKDSVAALFAAQGDEVAQGLTRMAQARDELMQNFNPTVAGRCEKEKITKHLHRFNGLILDRLWDDPRKNTYQNLLKQFGVSSEHLQTLEECTVEYFLEPRYEGLVTVPNPAFLRANRHTQTMLRLWVKNQKINGAVELRAYVGAGPTKGHYMGEGKLKRVEVHADGKVNIIQVLEMVLVQENSLQHTLRGSLTMSGLDYLDPFFGNPVPQLVSNVLTGTVSFDSNNGKVFKNEVLLQSRESNSRIEKALKVRLPLNAQYGQYLNGILIESVSAKSNPQELLKQVYAAYRSILRTEMRQSIMEIQDKGLHPSLVLDFVEKNRIALLVIDYSSDVQALAYENLKAAFAGTQIKITPLYDIEEGSFNVRFAGRSSTEMEFENKTEFIQSIQKMLLLIQQERALVFKKFGIEALMGEVQALVQEVFKSYQSIGERLKGMLGDEEISAELDQSLSEKFEILKTQQDALAQSLIQLIDTRNLKNFLNAIVSFWNTQLEILKLTGKSVPQDFLEKRLDSLAKANALAMKIVDQYESIQKALQYLSSFEIEVELEGKKIEKGKIQSLDWEWNRKLSKELESFIQKKGVVK